MIDIREYDLDIDTAEHDLLLGPQADLMRRVEDFNQGYGNNRGINSDIVGVTKRFRFKNGTYDKIKHAYGQHCLAFNMKPNGIFSLKDRISRHSWRQRQFWSNLEAIENAMSSLRYGNVFWQDNTDTIKDAWTDLKEKITAGIDKAVELNPNCSIEVRVQDQDGYSNLTMETTVEMKDIQLQIFLQDENVGSIDWGDVKIRFKTPLWDYLNQFCNGGTQDWTRIRNAGTAYQQRPRFYKSSHPYLGRGYNHHRDSEWNTHLCLGDLSNDIRESSARMNMEGLSSYVGLWLGRYHIPRTNPLNRIHNCFYGLPDGLDWRVIHTQNDQTPESRMSSCQWSTHYWDHYKSCNVDSNTGGLTCGVDMDGEPNLNLINNACSTCQFREAGETDSGVEFNKCTKAIVPYVEPANDLECQLEQLYYLNMCESFIYNHRGIITVRDSDPLRHYDEEHNLVWTDVLDIYFITQFVVDFAFDYWYSKESARWSHSQSDVQTKVDNLMDYWVDVSLRTNMEDELYNLCFPDGCSDDEEGNDAYEQFRDDCEAMSILELDEAITRAQEMSESGPARRRQMSSNSQQWDPLSVEVIDENLTVEERTIRWAAQNGGSINL